MKLDRGWGLRGALLAAAAGTFGLAGTAAAQSAAAGEAPGAALRRQVAELAANPSSVAELIETGRAALAVGDGEGALGFFTRADQLAPRDARVKAGLAAANARAGRPESALLLFAEAASLGAAPTEIAAERGLAYDLTGQTAKAQQDYLTALRHREDPEVRRRLALSLAISGQRAAALRVLDPQVRGGDRAGSRARVMVLAVSGDVNGAKAAAVSSLPPGSAQALTPFLTRLASLGPGQMAAAANLGRLPGSGAMRTASRGAATADPAALAFAGGGATSGTALASRLPVAPTDSSAVRRRPGAVNAAARAPARTAGPAAPERALASSSSTNAAPREAGRPTGSWTNASARIPVEALAQNSAPVAFLQPHPFEPLRLNPATGSGGSASTRAEAPVELAARAAPARVPDPVASAPIQDPVPTSDPAASEQPAQPTADKTTQPAVAAAAPALTADKVSQPVVAAAEPATPIQLASAQPAATTDLPADSSAANLAIWTSSAVTSAPAAAAPEGRGFSDVVATVASLVSEAETRTSATAPTSKPRTEPARSTSSNIAAPPRRTKPRTEAARSTSNNSAAPDRTTSPRASRATQRSAAARPAAATARTPAPHPSRVWVQLGVSPNRSAFGFEMTRLRKAAPDLLKDRTPHVAPIGSNHRLLVGPFPNDAAARTFINGLAKKDIAAVAWTSPAGTEVARFTAKK